MMRPLPPAHDMPGHASQERQERAMKGRRGDGRIQPIMRTGHAILQVRWGPPVYSSTRLPVRNNHLTWPQSARYHWPT